MKAEKTDFSLRISCELDLFLKQCLKIFILVKKNTDRKYKKRKEKKNEKKPRNEMENKKNESMKSKTKKIIRKRRKMGRFLRDIR